MAKKDALGEISRSRSRSAIITIGQFFSGRALMYSSNLPLVPSHAADESLFSWSAAVGRHCGHTSSSETSQRLFGHKSSGLNFDFPSGLEALARNVPDLYDSPSEWARQATLLPYLTKFASPGLFDRAVAAMSGSGGGAMLRPLLGLTGRVGQWHLQVRVCESCLKADSESIGRAAWRRSHLLPGVTMCTDHAQPLKTAVEITTGRQREFFGPRETLKLESVTQVESDGQAHQLRFARLSRQILDDVGEYNDREVLRLTYLHGLRDAGFVTPAGRLRRAQLRAATADHLVAVGLGPQLQGVSPSDLAIGVALGSRQVQRRATSWSHAVLIDFVFGSWERFISTYEWEKRLWTRAESNPGPAPLQYSNCTWDECCGTYPDSLLRRVC